MSLVSPLKKLTRQDISSLCNESRYRLSVIATNSYDFEPIIASCENALNNASSLTQTFMSGYVHEPTFMNVQIPLVWDIHKLLNTEMPVKTKDVPVLYLRSLMDPGLFDDPCGPSFSQGPVILAELPFCLPNACVIDGNHRVLAAFEHGIEALPTKLYYALDHFEFLSPYSRVLFGACCNILYASLLVEGKISVKKFDELSFDLG